jgi:hypothetical protein
MTDGPTTGAPMHAYRRRAAQQGDDEQWWNLFYSPDP